MQIKNILEYQSWTSKVWYCAQDKKNDLSVMSLGLTGEVAEVIEEFFNEDFNDFNTKTELGDVIYYWVRICNYFSFDIRTMFFSSLDTFNLIDDNKDLLLRISSNSGNCADIIKKYIRDGLLKEDLLIEKLTQTMKHIVNLIFNCNYDIFNIINMNIDKIEKKYSQENK